MKEENFYKAPKSLWQAKGYFSPKTGEAVQLKESEKLVYVYMLDRLIFFVDKQKGQHFESQATIADACGLEYKVVGKILRSFMDHSVIEGKKLRPNGVGQWRWYYTSILNDLSYWSGTIEDPEIIQKVLIEAPIKNQDQPRKTSFVPATINPDFDDLPF